MQSRHTVDAVRAGHAQVGHTHGAARDHSHTLHLVCVMGSAPNKGTEAVVDLLGDLINTGQQALVQVLAPALQRLFHHRVVGVRHRFGYQFPSRVPIIAALVQHNAHQLRNGQGGVGIVNMDRHLLRQIIQRAVLGQVTVNNILHRGGHQEILLAQAQGLALRRVICRIQHLTDGLCHGRLFHSLNILALIKQTHIQCRLASRPQAQTSHTVAQTAYIHIIGHSDHGVAIPHRDGMVLTVPAFIDPAFKTDSLGALLTGH